MQKALSMRGAVALLVALLAAALSPASAPPGPAGAPDLSGVWTASFLTPLERPPFAQGLAVRPEDEAAFVARLVAARPGVLDPDVAFEGLRNLAVVNGEIRSSVIVDPPD